MSMKFVKYLTAAEAREKSKRNNLLAEGSQYIEIQDLINKATIKGSYELWYYKVFNDDVGNRLIEEGFNVSNTQYERGGPMTKITW